MKQIVKHIAFQSLIFFLTVQTLNLSINSLDFYAPINVSNSIEDQDYVDSMIEFLVENLLGFSKNTFHDKANIDNFSKQQQNIAHFDLKWFPNSMLFSDIETTQNEIVYMISKNEKVINLYFKEVPAKPPQFLSV